MGKKIEIKTRWHDFAAAKEEKYGARTEGCPTVKKEIIEDNTCDFIVFVNLYIDKKCKRIYKKNIYVFGQSDFEYFSPLGTINENKGNYTILNIIKAPSKSSPKWKEICKEFKTDEIKQLFRASKNKWTKINSSIIY